MTIDEDILIVMSIVTIVGIIVVYTAACVLGIMFIKRAEWTRYSMVKIFMIICDGLVAVAYVVALYKLSIGDPWLNDTYAIIIIRPILFLLGTSLALAAFTRYITLLYGGEIWKLRKP